MAQTGRLSSTNPNMQNVPIRTPLGREIRGCFEAEEGSVLISADYSQIELRVLAHAAGEDVLMEIFERGEDVHTATASRVFGVQPDEIDPGMRSKAKMINYGIVYGLSDFGLADRLNIPREEAKEFIDAYLERFPRVAAFMAETIEQAKEEGDVKTLWGRRRQIPELRARNYQVRTLGERLAVNTVIQGTAADIIKLAMVRLPSARWPSPGLQTRLLLTIHDELLFEGPPAEAAQARGADRARDGAACGSSASRRWRWTSASGATGWRPSDAGWPVVSRGLAVLVGVGAGCLVGMQAPINARLGKSVGSVQAATFSFLVGTVVLLCDRRVRQRRPGQPRPASGERPGGRSSAVCSARST